MGYRLNKLVTTQKYWRRKLEERQGGLSGLAPLLTKMCVKNSNAIMHIVDDTEIIRTNRDRRIIFMNPALSHVFYEYSHSIGTILYSKDSKVAMLFVDDNIRRKRNITDDEKLAIISHEYGHLAFKDLVGKISFFNAILNNVSKVPTLISCENIVKMYLNLTEEAFADVYTYASGRQESLKHMISALEKIKNPEEDSKKYINEDKIISFHDLAVMRIDTMKRLENNEEFHQIVAMTSNKKYKKLISVIADAIYEEIEKRVDLEEYVSIMKEKISTNNLISLYK